MRRFGEPSIARAVLAVVLLVVQMLVLAIVLCPLVVLYVLGLYLSAGVSLWRLIQHDYGNPDGGANNLKPALNVLYSLAVAQGVVYGYRAIYDSAARTGLADNVAKDYSLEMESVLVSDYLEETVAGCMKDPSFARGRNLITYAVDLLMQSKSRYDYISGVLILGAILDSKSLGQPSLLKQLLTESASFSHVVQRLLETFGRRSPYSTEIRLRAARIVATVAGSIRLDQLPQGMIIECISTLLDTFEEYSWRPEGYYRPGEGYYTPLLLQLHSVYERDWLLDEDERYYSYRVVEIPRTKSAWMKTRESDSGKLRLQVQGYKGLVVQGLRILQGLAVNEENCRVISKTEDLLSKTMAPLVSDKLHGDHHDEWSFIAVESLEFMKRLMATLSLGGTDTTKLRSEISSNSQATIFRTLECHKCQVLPKRHAAQVFLYLSPDASPSIVPGASGSSSSSIIFIWILLDIFLLPDYRFDRMCGATHFAKKDSDTTRLAGEKMQSMVSSITEASDTSMLPSVGYVFGSLARTVAGAENNVYRIHAATILEHLCEHYTKDDEILKELKKAVANVMEVVVNEIVLLAQKGLNFGYWLDWRDNGQESLSTNLHRKVEQHLGIIQPQEALIQLCKWIDEDKDEDLTRQFNEIAAKIRSRRGVPHKTFREFLGKAQEQLRDQKMENERMADMVQKWREEAARKYGPPGGTET